MTHTEVTQSSSSVLNVRSTPQSLLTLPANNPCQLLVFVKMKFQKKTKFISPDQFHRAFAAEQKRIAKFKLFALAILAALSFPSGLLVGRYALPSGEDYSACQSFNGNVEKVTEEAINEHQNETSTQTPTDDNFYECRCDPCTMCEFHTDTPGAAAAVQQGTNKAETSLEEPKDFVEVPKTN